MRVKIVDPSESRKRYAIPAGDVLISDQDLDARRLPLSLAAAAEAKVSASFTDEAGQAHEVSLTVDAQSKMSFALDGRVFQVWNGKKMLNFESVRPKSSSPYGLSSCDVGVDATCFPGALTDSMWEETFAGSTDTKPYGPQAIGIDVGFPDSHALLGMPEHTNKLLLTSLSKMEEPYRFFNLDVFEYELDSAMALYGAIPMVTALYESSKTASSFFWSNPSDTFVWVEREKVASKSESFTDWVSESGSFDAFVLPGPSPADTVVQYHSLTGPAAMPPVFSLGKHQCRWNYVDTADVEQVDRNFDKYDMPYDVLWLDIEHTDGKRYFTWDNRHFKEPAKMIEDLSSRGRKMVTIVDPHIKVDTNYQVYKGMPLWTQKKETKMIDDPNDRKPVDWDQPATIPDPNAQVPEDWNAEEDGEYERPQVSNPDYKGTWTARKVPDPNVASADFEGWCWPGNSKYPDFTSPKVREYWAQQFAYNKYGGSTKDLFTWNDMNEPSVFNGPEVTMPLDALHEGMVEHRDVHNLYGYYHHRATFEGHQFREPTQRPFVLSRAFFAGTHRYGAIWTGDNFARWDHYQISVPMLLSMSMCGLSFIGADVGGFFKHPDKQLITRWHQFGAVAYPFYRSHAHLETPRREPWMYDQEVVDHVRVASRLRYSFLPMWYTLFAEHVFKGLPVVRPLWFDHMSDTSLYESDHADKALVVGENFLVVAADNPHTEPSVPVYLPGPDEWYDFWTGVRHKSGPQSLQNSWDHVPIFIRAGAILCTKSRARRSTQAQTRDPYTLTIYADGEGRAGGRLYVDDGASTSYESGAFVYQKFDFAAGVLRSEALSIGHRHVRPDIPQKAVQESVGVGIERIDVRGTSFTRAVLAMTASQAPVPLTVKRLNDVLTIKLPQIEVGKHGWEIRLGGDELLA
jgi:alpha 1,3-glucosidase